MMTTAEQEYAKAARALVNVARQASRMGAEIARGAFEATAPPPNLDARAAANVLRQRDRFARGAR